MGPLKIEEFDQLNDDDLYLLIGQEVLKDEKSFTMLTPKQIIEKTKVWFKLNIPKFQDRICHNETIKKSYEKQEAINTTTALVDLIAGALTGIAPATAAYLLYRQGINLLCKSYWTI